MNSAVMEEMSEKQTVKFGDICCEVKLTTKDPLADGYDKYIGLEHLDSGSLKIKRWGSVADDNPSFTRVFKKGQILFGRRRAYLKKAAIAEFDGICSGDIIVISPKEGNIYSGLVQSVIHSEPFWQWAIKNSAGGLSPRTKFKQLAEFTFPIKSDSQVSGFSQVFNSMNNSGEKFLTYSESVNKLGEVLINYFTRYGTRNEDLVDSVVGKIPHTWEVLRFSELYEIDSKNGLYKPKDYYGAGPKMVHMGEMFKSREIAWEEIESSVEVTDAELSSFGLHRNDLLFARRSLTREGAGLCCIYKGADDSASFESSIIRVRLNENTANADFFNYFFRSKYGRWLMERIIQTVAASGITGGDLKKMHVPVPPLDEQNVIVELIHRYMSLQEVSDFGNASRERLLSVLNNKLVMP